MIYGHEAVVWIFCGSLYLMAGFLWIAHNMRSQFAQRTLEEHEQNGNAHWWILAIAVGVIVWPISLALSVLVLAIKSAHRDEKG